MASAWGKSWGLAWGNAWGAVTAAVPSMGSLLWLYAGGGRADWERKRAKLLASKKKDVEEAVAIIEQIAAEQPKAPVKELRQELKKADIVFTEEYKKLLKMLIRAEIEAQQEHEDEEALIMLM
jgi:hypothetical protein